MKVCKIKGRSPKVPVRAHKNDAGIDFFAPLDMEEIVVEPHKDVLIHSGIRVDIPEGYCLLGANKSGVATKKHLVHGSHIIDCGYQGEVDIHLFNIGDTPTFIKPGEKIIQFLLVPVSSDFIEEISEDEYFANGETERGQGGFGSTGV